MRSGLRNGLVFAAFSATLPGPAFSEARCTDCNRPTLRRLNRHLPGLFPIGAYRHHGAKAAASNVAAAPAARDEPQRSDSRAMIFQTSRRRRFSPINSPFHPARFGAVAQVAACLPDALLTGRPADLGLTPQSRTASFVRPAGGIGGASVALHGISLPINLPADGCCASPCDRFWADT
jgi:hypothetical protein